MLGQRTIVGPLTVKPIWRHSRADAILVALSVAHAGVLAIAVVLQSDPRGHAVGMIALAICLWWNANTVSHNFIHLPFFTSRGMNRTYSAFLSLLLGAPQTLWREKHLAHHAGTKYAFRWSAELVVEAFAVLAFWLALLLVAPGFFVTVYAPAYVIGMGLCFLQGRFEHSPSARSHYGSLYNAAFFNDGYHIEHHKRPGRHWARLPDQVEPGEASPYPPVLRWLELVSLTGLERMVLRSRRLQRFVLRRHAQALRRLLTSIGEAHSVTIVGGGLFPRTAIIVRSLLPDARIRIIDVSRRNLETARRFLADAGLERGIELVCARFETRRFDSSSDVLITPLSLIGDRDALHSKPPARNVLAHDWIWRRGSAESARVSWLLLKRLNRLSGECGA